MSSPVVLLKGLKENEPRNYDKARWIIACKDCIKYKLTGVICTDETDASSGFVDVRTRTYSSEI